MTVFEIAYLPLKSGLDLENPASDEWQILRDVLGTLASQKGFIRAFYGRQIEVHDMLLLFVEWVELQSHENFTKSPVYDPFLARWGAILCKPASFYHVPLSPDFSSAGAAPVTEFVAWYFPPSFDTTEWDDGFEIFDKAMRENAEAFHGSASGWSIDEASHGSLKDEGGKGKVFVLTVGWDSVDAHGTFRETEAFKRNIGLLRNKGSTAAEMRHVSFEEVEKIPE